MKFLPSTGMKLNQSKAKSYHGKLEYNLCLILKLHTYNRTYACLRQAN